MKLRIFEFLLVVAIGVLLATNPTLEDYSDHLRQQIVQDAQGQDQLSKDLAGIFGGLAGNIMSNLSKRKNYLLFSTYETDMNSEVYRCIGIAGNFVNCRKARTTQPQPRGQYP